MLSILILPTLLQILSLIPSIFPSNTVGLLSSLNTDLSKIRISDLHSLRTFAQISIGMTKHQPVVSLLTAQVFPPPNGTDTASLERCLLCAGLFTTNTDVEILSATLHQLP